jgi:uncharacterized membrane protein YeiB
MTATDSVRPQLDGLDLARYLAFVGMVFVNFKIAMGADTDDTIISTFITALEGRAAATFVILAGIGLGLSRVQSYKRTVYGIGKRALLLFMLGCLNMLVFDADIIHYYAVYFFLAAFFLPLRTRWLFLVILLVNILFLAMIFLLDYELGWDWKTYSYPDFWTFDGFVRNLFFNGWHPVFPWVSFVFFGIILSRLRLHTRSTQHRLIAAGLSLMILIEGLSLWLTPLLMPIDADLATLVTTKPIPPLPLYILAGSGFACFLLGLCLRSAAHVKKLGILPLFAPAGRQTLTLYFAHILVGMGILEALQMLDGQTAGEAARAALIFCIGATAFSYVWAKRFTHGPLESLLKLAGK